MSELTPIQKAQLVRKEKGTEVLNPRQKFEKKQTRSTSINAKCFECQGEDADAGWKWRIGNCECEECALYPFRPYQSFYGKEKPITLK